MDWIILKFGGTSVASSERWLTIAEQVSRVRNEGARPLVVCSALSGVTDLLEGLCDAALAGTARPILAEIEQRHVALAGEMGVVLGTDELSLLDELKRVASGVAMVGEASPRTRARILATGELLSTRLGTLFLRTRGLSAAWLDARTALTAANRPGPAASAWLAADCDVFADDALNARLSALDADVIVTQGFVVGADSGDTAVLGRGGSDTSAAFFAARLSASRCEIWTDVPGMFTADPRLVPQARLLRRLDYSEAQEIASTGAKVLHPRCLAPLRESGIPMVIRSAADPSLEGTHIEALPSAGVPQVKALSSKKNVTLVSMDTVGMWQQAGFLARVFGVFGEHGLSIDLVSTSETNITVTLDSGANVIDGGALEALARDLKTYCRVSITSGLAAVSLVGIGIRSILHRIAPALQQFEDNPVHLVSQAASDLNLTFVVDASRVETMLRRLHAELLQGAQEGETFGPTWRSLSVPNREPAKARSRWWRSSRDALIAEAAHGTPAYAYDAATIRRAVQGLQGLGAVDRVFYAMKANSFPEVLKLVADSGLGFECVSPREVALAGQYVDSSRLLFTPNFAPRADYEAAYAAGAAVTVDSMHPLQHWPEVFAGRELLLRIDIGLGRGHHEHVKTAGAKSKFGIDPAELEAVADAVAAAGARVVGLHAHSGSGIRTPDAWRDVATRLTEYAPLFPHVCVLDVGGGLAVPEKPAESELDLGLFDASLKEVREAFEIDELWIEPGRFVVAEAGVLLTTVTQIKRKRGVTWIGVDAGMHSLIRPALYGAWHEIVNLSRLSEPATELVHVVGPICESGDVLGRERRLPPTQEGDILLVAVAGAYGRCMASGYNMRGLPREVLIDATARTQDNS